MRKRVFGRHLNRDTNERKALFKNLMTELVLHEQVTTTEEKAKAIRGQAEKLVTKAKRKGQASEYLLQPFLPADAVKKVIADLAPRFVDRQGGYTRITKLGNRLSDNASIAVIEWVDRPEARSMNLPAGRQGQELLGDELDEPMEIQEAEIVTEESKKKASKKTSTAKTKIEKKEPREKKIK